MLGHKCCQILAEHHDVWATVRSDPNDFSRYNLLKHSRLLGSVDGMNIQHLLEVVEEVRPEALLNAIGLVKQIPQASDPVLAITINSLLPHHLAKLCTKVGARFIHISTDCVFSGARGGYLENDVPDAADLYGRSKLLGEVGGEGSLTLRTSIIGRELTSTNGLVEWFLSHRGASVQGYERSIFSGLSTLLLADVIADVLENHPQLSGIWHVSTTPVTKLRLLELINRAYDAQVEIEPVKGQAIDRSLDSSRFKSVTGFNPPSWEQLIEEMANDPTPYERWRTRS